jgi:hypothetical protein
MLSDRELASAMAEMDADGSGEVDFDEFAHWCAEAVFIFVFCVLCFVLFLQRVCTRRGAPSLLPRPCPRLPAPDRPTDRVHELAGGLP